MNNGKVENEPLVVLDAFALLGFSHFAKVASADRSQSLDDLCRLLSKRGAEGLAKTK